MRPDRSLLLAAASALAITISAFSMAAAEPLPEAVAEALSHHPGVEAALANRNALLAEQKETKSQFFPQLNVRGAGGRNYADNSTSRGLDVTRGTGYSWLWEGSLTVTQHIWNGFETESRAGAAEARFLSADYNVADAQENLALRAVIAYLDVLRAEESVSRLKTHGRKIDDYISRIRAMVNEGAADESMIVQASDIRAQLESARATSEGQLRAAIATFEEVVGRPPAGELLRPVPRLDIIPDRSVLAVSYAMDHHPLLKAAAMDREAQSREANAEKAALYPDITGELSYYERDLDDVIGGEITDAKALVRMNWDYALGGAHQARVRRTLYREAESRARMEERRREIERRIQVSYSDRQAAREQVTIQRERVALNKSLLDTYESQFEAARVNLLQIMQTDNALFNARMALLNGEYKLLASEYAVLASMGRLVEALNIGAVAVSAAD